MPNYDLAVVGSGVAGLTAAATAARLKKKVIVLDSGKKAGGVLAAFVRDRFRFTTGPVCSYGFERGGVFQTLAENLGMSQTAALRSPCYQVALPDRRITVFAEQSETLEELRREFPKEIESIIRLYRDIRSQADRNSRNRLAAFFCRHRSAVSFLGTYRFSNEFLVFLDVQSRYFFGKSLDLLLLPSLITLLDSAPFTLPGGFNRLVDSLVEVLLKNQGEIQYEVPLTEISIRRDGLDLPTGPIKATAALLNMPPSQAGRVCFGLRQQVIPEAMLPVVLCVPAYSNPECIFTLSVSEGDDETAAPRGMRAMTASFSPSFPEKTLKGRLHAIELIVPFLNNFSVFSVDCSSPTQILRLPQDFSPKRVLSSRQEPGLDRSSRYGTCVIPDGTGTIEGGVKAAQRFMEFVK